MACTRISNFSFMFKKILLHTITLAALSLLRSLEIQCFSEFFNDVFEKFASRTGARKCRWRVGARFGSGKSVGGVSGEFFLHGVARFRWPSLGRRVVSLVVS